MTRFTVNGQPVEYKMDPQTPLLWALRDASNLTGAKYGCGTGHCGACTVDVDGEAVRSCQMSIGAAEGTFVTTIEGLSKDRSHPVQRAFLDANLVQCGYCVPGIVMAAAVLLKKNRAPSDDDIKKSITNICRCGVYPRLIDAIHKAAALGVPAENQPTPAAIEPKPAAATTSQSFRFADTSIQDRLTADPANG